jgi:hypothetical protein
MALLDVQDTQSTTAVTTAGGVGIINGAERRPRYRCAVRVVRYAPFLLFLFFFFFSYFFLSLDRVFLFDMFEFPVSPRKRKAEMRRLNWEFIWGNVTCNFEIPLKERKRKHETTNKQKKK